MAGYDLPFSCTCGQIHGALCGVSPANGNRVDCHCKDCRAAIIFASPDNTAPDGPVPLYQTTPSRVRFDAGQDQLAVFSLSPTGILRWYAKCCGALLFNTLRTPKMAFAAFFMDRTADATPLGPVRTQANMPNPDGTSSHKGLPRAIFSFMRGAMLGRMTGRWKDTPFFDPITLDPVCEIKVLTLKERAAASAV